MMRRPRLAGAAAAHSVRGKPKVPSPGEPKKLARRRGELLAVGRSQRPAVWPARQVRPRPKR